MKFVGKSVKFVGMSKKFDLIRNTDRQKRPNLSALVAAMIKMHKIKLYFSRSSSTVYL